MSRTPWYDSENPSTVARGAGWRTGVIIISVIAFFAVIGAVTFGVRVLTSDVRGQGEAEIMKNSGTNRVAAQERFETLYADIKAADSKLDQAAADKAANPGDRFHATNYTGLVSYCIDLIGQYNAEARKFSAKDFRSIDLPSVIDETASSTDCKETQQ